MKIEKPIIWLINLLLTAALAFSVLVLIERLPGMECEWYSRSLRCYPLLLCFLVGLLSRGKNLLKWLLLPLSCLASSALIFFLFPSHAAGDIVYIALTLPIGAGIFILGLRGDLPFPPRASIAAILFYIVICVYFYIKDGSQSALLPMSYCALGSFLLSLYSFNLSGLKGGMHSTKNGGGGIPAGMRGRNVFMLTVFLVVAVPIASLGFLHRGLGSMFGFVLSGIGKLLSALSGSGESAVKPQPTQSTEPKEPDSLAFVEDGPMAGRIFVAIFISLMLLTAIVFIIAIFAGENKVGGKRGSLKGFFKRLFRTHSTEDYKDSVERTALKDIIKQRREKISKFFEKLTTRAETFDDMPNNRMRVRFAYKSLLASSRVNRRALYCTPNELAEQLNSDELTRLADAYNSARYQESADVPPGDAEAAKTALASLRKAKKR